MGENIRNHTKRDQAIPEQRKKLINAIERDLLGDDNILAVFYGGSIGNGCTDLYSDIDLRIVVKDDMFEQYRLNKKERAKTWGNVLFFEDFPWTTYSIAHFDTFIKVDTFYYHIKGIQPSVWLQEIKIVKDSQGFVDQVVEKSRKLSYLPSLQDVDIWRTKFFSYVHEVYRRVQRGEIYYALQCIDNLRLSITTGWFMVAGIQPNTFGDWAKIEGSRSRLEGWQLSLLEGWYSKRDREDIFKVTKAIIPEFKKIHESLCEMVGLEMNDQWVDEIVGMTL
ncbi:hypothetical protein DS745_02645 [Anaerobacillus alkaliphilus]|uniref:Nucleotidyltransferase domain-containing protein n=1 Tax=Anaerobacillus alkaliphilus TaxID=1548597 RepID=A0A4Q0VY11_9BACI|nr:aminoglycoside 6-adenylyltransferase [Anaerobacillus alkaliphilus]RXJ04302.1 hypothetical protein DS745_02645 [Anaerobacillus alkaliphilus]